VSYVVVNPTTIKDLPRKNNVNYVITYFYLDIIIKHFVEIEKIKQVVLIKEMLN
jgi:hypothetical protein